MQRGTALFEFFATGYFRTTKTTTNFYFDTFGTHTHCSRDSHFHRTLVAYTAFYLAGNCFTYYHRIQLGTTDLHNVDLYIFFTGQLLQFFFDAVYLCATFTYDDTRLRCVDGNDQLTQCTLNNDT